jgi:hypothetical protein
MLTFIHPLFLGVWLLRATNDQNFDKSTTFLEIKENNKVDLFTKFNDGIIGKTYQRAGYIVDPPKWFVKNINLYFTEKILYSYSILGFKIPEAAKMVFSYQKPKRFNIKREGNTILVKESSTKKFYIFDLYVKEYNSPAIETRWNHFLFIQMISFLFNIILVQALHVSMLETIHLGEWIQNNTPP